ncbi:hypothetical protein MBLNU459_g2879t1 [Dothideomycetes sp. NU459]
MTTNGLSARTQLLPGIHVPTPTLFEDTDEQEIDYALQRKHHEFMITSGLAGIVIAGSTGEAVALTTEEKVRLVKETRKLAQDLHRPDVQLTLGVSGQCTRDVVKETKAAAEAGADFVLVITPSYFAFGLTQDSIVAFFQEVADRSPVPVIIYNWPGVTNGIEISSDIVDVLGQHPNIAAIKFTCGGIAKVARVADRFKPTEFAALAGQSDWLVAALAVGGVGAITGMANFYPRLCIQLQDLFRAGKVEEARILQGEVASAEWALAKGGINGMKWAITQVLGYPQQSSKPRRPYGDFAGNEKGSWVLERLGTLKSLEAKLAEGQTLG